MPYADVDRQRQSKVDWCNAHPERGAFGPTGNLIADILDKSDIPLSPSQISLVMAALGKPTSVGMVNRTLNGMQHAGRVRRLGYGQWVIAREWVQGG